MIEVAGLVADDIGQLPGVVSVRREREGVVVLARSEASDDALRSLLAGDEAIRVLRVDRDKDAP